MSHNIYDDAFYSGWLRAEQWADDKIRQHREYLEAQRAENERAEREAEAEHARNQELNRRRPLRPWYDPLPAKQQQQPRQQTVPELIQAVQDGCGEVLLLTGSMIDRMVHHRVMHRLVQEARAEAKQRYGNNPTRLATSDELCNKRFREIFRDQDGLARAATPVIDKQAKNRIRILAPAPTHGIPWSEGTYAPRGYKPSAEVLAATNRPPPVLRVVDYYPQRMPGFVPKTSTAKKPESKS